VLFYKTLQPVPGYPRGSRNAQHATWDITYSWLFLLIEDETHTLCGILKGDVTSEGVQPGKRGVFRKVIYIIWKRTQKRRNRLRWI